MPIPAIVRSWRRCSVPACVCVWRRCVGRPWRQVTSGSTHPGHLEPRQRTQSPRTQIMTTPTQHIPTQARDTPTNGPFPTRPTLSVTALLVVGSGVVRDAWGGITVEIDEGMALGA